MFAVSQGGGSCVGPGDVCVLPNGLPLPFINTASPSNGTGFVPNIFMVTGMAHNQGTVIPNSTGDEPGRMGGVISGTYRDQASYVTCSNTVLMGGMPTPRLSTVTLQNRGNVQGAVVAPSQTKVLILAP